jgi:hypothetical protein
MGQAAVMKLVILAAIVLVISGCDRDFGKSGWYDL